MLRNAPLRSKLFVTLVGPLLALAILAAVVIGSSLAESEQAGQVNGRARFAAELAPLVHALQAERSLSSSFVASARGAGRAQLAAERADTDRLAAAYLAAASRLDLGGDPGLGERLGYGARELGKLRAQRAAIDRGPLQRDLHAEPRIDEGEVEGELDVHEDHGPIDTPGEAIEQYTDTINDLLDVNAEIAPGSQDQRLLEAVRAQVALSRAKEFADHQRGLLYDVLSRHGFGSGQYGKLTSLAAAEVIYTAQFESAATREQLELYERIVGGPRTARVERMRGDVVEGGDAGPVAGDAAAWYGAASARLNGMREVEQRLSADIVATSAAIKAGADRRALLYILLLVAAVSLAVAVSLATARSLITRLGRLRDVANDVAERRLPDVVTRLREGGGADLEAESATPIDVRARDEIGQLGEAFSFVHRVALQLAGREAALRRSVGEMFLNLARRSQSLVERQLELIADLGSRESSPEGLMELSELDHLAARMRRNAENLIVLSGTESAPRWRAPVAVADLVAAAIDEVREHGRVELLPLHEGMIAGHGAAGVVRLVAELLENALSFSAPETKVLVSGQALPSGYLIEIEDRGIGMTDEQLAEVNRRLSEPPEVDLASAKVLGFYVIGQLAARHAIKVQLRRSLEGGVGALVLLPPALVIPPEEHPVPGRLSARLGERPTRLATGLKFGGSRG
jgi:HAMP domain-containing protein